jgi:hypothetical protein
MPRLSTVTATEWGVSYQTSSATEGATLNVYRLHNDRPNQWGGMGTVENHPVYDGMQFATVDEASAYALMQGLLRVWHGLAVESPVLYAEVSVA